MSVGTDHLMYEDEVEEHLEKGLFCHCWLNVGIPGKGLVGLLLLMFAKVCKILQLPTLEF